MHDRNANDAPEIAIDDPEHEYSADDAPKIAAKIGSDPSANDAPTIAPKTAIHDPN